MKIVFAVMMSLAWAGGALAEEAPVKSTWDCKAPIAPAPLVTPTVAAKPVMPSCINPATRLSTCSNKVLVAYNNAVDARNSDLEKAAVVTDGYQDALNTYVREASSYANCEVSRLNSELRRVGR